MKNKKLYVLALVPMLLLTSCDKEITKEEAAAKAANIQTAQKTTTFNSLKTTVEYSAKTVGGSTSMKYTLAFDKENKFISFKISGSYAYGENKGESSAKYYVFVSETEGLVAAKNVDGKKTYVAMNYAFDDEFDDIIDEFDDMTPDSPLDADDILSDVKNGKDISKSMNAAFSGFGTAVTLSADYAVTYFSNSSSSFGVAVSVNSKAETKNVYTASGESRVEWNDNLLSKVSCKAKLTINKNEYSLKVSQSNKYNTKVTENVNLDNYTKAE